MLREMDNVRQVEGERRRRWFYDPRMDLTVWVEPDGSPAGFQLAYEVLAHEKKILTWLPERGFSHETLDDGEDRPFRYKMTPVTVPDGLLDSDRLLAEFLRESEGMEEEVREFVAERIRGYGR